MALTRLADWQLPAGVSRGLWDYFHDASLARSYDESLAGCALLDVDRRFAERHFDRPGRLIDLGCGTGRLLVPFARRGYWVLGVDLSGGQLARARKRLPGVHRETPGERPRSRHQLLELGNAPRAQGLARTVD